MNDPGILSLIPTVITILVALVSHRIILAMCLGIVSGAIVLEHSSFISIIKNICHYGYITCSDPERLKIALFLLLVGGLLGIISESGAYIEFAKKLVKYLNSAVKVRLTTFILGILIFFDDYASVLIAGTSMRSITEEKKISPALMAYIVDTVATVVSITILSTWSAFESSLMVSSAESAGIKKSAVDLLLSSLPYHICTYCGIFLAFLVALTGKWFGKKFEDKGTQEKKEETIIGEGAGFLHVFIPILTLILCAIGGLLYSGYKKFNTLKNSEINIINLLGDAPTIHILIFSTLMSLLICIILLKKDRIMPGGTMRKSFLTGLKHMVSASLLIMLSKGLSQISGDLGTGLYITGIFSSFAGYETLPVIITVIAALVTIATGISWSSMAILMPIAYDMALNKGGSELLAIMGGAVISGSILGGLLIPYSDTSVMASSAFKITTVYHVKTQFPQVMTVLGVSLAAYLLIGFGVKLWAVYLMAAAVLGVAHWRFAR